MCVEASTLDRKNALRDTFGSEKPIKSSTVSLMTLIHPSSFHSFHPQKSIINLLGATGRHKAAVLSVEHRAVRVGGGRQRLRRQGKPGIISHAPRLKLCRRVDRRDHRKRPTAADEKPAGLANSQLDDHRQQHKARRHEKVSVSKSINQKLQKAENESFEGSQQRLGSNLRD